MKQQDPLLQTIIDGIQEKKGKSIVTVDLSHINSSSAQQFVICQGSSTIQVSSIADSVREMVQEQLGIKPFNYDGYQNSQWIVIDYGHLFVHVFLPEYREYYRLEQLWGDAKITGIADLD